MSATTGTHFRSYPSHFVSPIPYCVVNSQKVIVIERPGSPKIHTANLYPRHFSTTTKINKEQARGKGKKGGYKDSAICLPPTVFSIPHPPLPSWELNCRLPSRHSCALPSLFSGRSSPFFILSRYASDTQDGGMRKGLREFRQLLWNGFRERVVCKRQKW